MHRIIMALTLGLFIFSTHAVAGNGKWSLLYPSSNQPNVYRAFVYANENDDRLEIACNKKRIDFFYSANKKVSKAALRKIRSGKPETLVRLKSGLAGIRPDTVEQSGGRLLFVTNVKPVLLKDMAGHTSNFVAGIRAAGQIVSQSLFPSNGLQQAVRGLAKGCGF